MTQPTCNTYAGHGRPAVFRYFPGVHEAEALDPRNKGVIVRAESGRTNLRLINAHTGEVVLYKIGHAARIWAAPVPFADAEAMLKAVEELAARWHRTAENHSSFNRGRCEGYAQAIALFLGTELAAVKVALAEERL
jgi:hypothetical protein